MRAIISSLSALSHASLPGVLVFPLDGNMPKRGQEQSVLVQANSGAMIPLHTHDTDATMIIVSGSGRVLSEDPSANGREVEPGHCVFFEARKPHGFEAGPNGLRFISRNGGIVDGDGNWDLQGMAA